MLWNFLKRFQEVLYHCDTGCEKRIQLIELELRSRGAEIHGDPRIHQIHSFFRARALKYDTQELQHPTRRSTRRGARFPALSHHVRCGAQDTYAYRPEGQPFRRQC